MTHIRHSAGERNRRKTGHHLGCYKDEIEKMWSDLASLRRVIARLSDGARYLEGRLCRIENRLETERRAARHR